MTKGIEFGYVFMSDESVPCKIGDNFEGAGKPGQYFGKININGMDWAIVLFDDEEDPELHKAVGIMVQQIKYVNAKHIDD